MIVTYCPDPNRKLTAEELKQIEEAAKLPIVPDEDCPVFTEEEFARMPKVRGRRFDKTRDL